MANLAAVVGIGQTKYQTKRGDVSIAGLVREAAVNALQDADLGWDDIDAVVIGKAPDMFEGVIMPESLPDRCPGLQRQTHAAGAHCGFGGRFHRPGGGIPCAKRHFQTGADGDL